MSAELAHGVARLGRDAEPEVAEGGTQVVDEATGCERRAIRLDEFAQTAALERASRRADTGVERLTVGMVDRPDEIDRLREVLVGHVAAGREQARGDPRSRQRLLVGDDRT